MRRLIALLFVLGVFLGLLGGTASAANCQDGQENATANTAANGADSPFKHFLRGLGCT
jgi:hypothetical protein